jgi:hypothetical protein
MAHAPVSIEIAYREPSVKHVLSEAVSRLIFA